MVGILIALLLLGVSMAGPFRAVAPRPDSLEFVAGRAKNVLIVKLAEHQGLGFSGGQVTGPGSVQELTRLLTDAKPLFQRSAKAIRAERARVDPEGRLADLSLYLRLEGPDLLKRGAQLLRDNRIETVYFAPVPVPPPGDLDPATPDFSDEQRYRLASPAGLGFDTAHQWPGGTGANITIADLEYGFDATHEDLGALGPVPAWGWDSGEYQFHGNGVAGILVGGDNGYGVTGLVPDAQLLMISPFETEEIYNVAGAIDAAATLLDAGDVLLIEQQGWVDGRYVPVEYEPAVFDAISLAVARGIVVVEPAGNGAVDLDDAEWAGWFDRSRQDSGAIMVGGGASPDSGQAPRSWVRDGSGYGTRIDLQGWYDGLVTTSAEDGFPSFTDLYFPDRDGRQAYTSMFTGTSAAAPLVAAVAAVANSVAWETRGAPWNPLELRAALKATGNPQAADDPFLIGSEPDLRRFLRTWGVR